MDSVNAFLRCLAAILVLTIGPFAAAFVVIFAVVGAGLMLACIPTGPAFPACVAGVLTTLTSLGLALGLILTAIALVSLIGGIVFCLTSTPAPAAAAGATPVGGAVDSVVDCASAEALLVQARAALAAAEANEDQARDSARRADRRVRTAQIALAAASLTLAGGLLQPWLIPGALIAMAAATALLARRSIEQAVARAVLAAAQAALALAMADLAAAEALVLAFCRPPAGQRDPALTGGVLLAGRTPAGLTSGVADCGCRPSDKRS